LSVRISLPFVSTILAAVVALPAAIPHRAPTAGVAERGLAVLQHFNDSLPRNAGNGLRCTSCHLDDGLRGSAMSWVAVTARYPKYRARRGGPETIEQRVNECITRSLAGRMLGEDDQAMKDIVAYFESLRQMPVPSRPDTVRVAGDTRRGEEKYAANCARCHGARGAGGVSPAVLGAQSYSIGAGLARQSVLATFLKWNMPYDMAGTLADQDAADIAAWVLRQPRQDHPGKELDWPNGDAPADVAYATNAAAARGLPSPPRRPLLRRRVSPRLVSK
jgi:thiosulfate dehydrogenase